MFPIPCLGGLLVVRAGQSEMRQEGGSSLGDAVPGSSNLVGRQFEMLVPSRDLTVEKKAFQFFPET